MFFVKLKVCLIPRTLPWGSSSQGLGHSLRWFLSSTVLSFSIPWDLQPLLEQYVEGAHHRSHS